VIVEKFEEKDVQDAMLAKKPLGGWSCASCAKNIVNLQSQLAEYSVSSQFPGKDMSRTGASRFLGRSEYGSRLQGSDDEGEEHENSHAKKGDGGFEGDVVLGPLSKTGISFKTHMKKGGQMRVAGNNSKLLSPYERKGGLEEKRLKRNKGSSSLPYLRE